MFHVPNDKRIRSGRLKSTSEDGNNGAFRICTIKFTRTLNVIASDQMGWDHVSVSCHDRTPTWEEMNYIKDLFWDKSDTVIQFHPPESEYVNNHPYCLHMWRNQNQVIELPPSIMVGIKELGQITK